MQTIFTKPMDYS
jgi:hypothetical protein